LRIGIVFPVLVPEENGLTSYQHSIEVGVKLVSAAIFTVAFVPEVATLEV
jgi:hypothetical protein